MFFFEALMFFSFLGAGLAYLALFVGAIYGVVKHRRLPFVKLCWIIAILFLPVFGPILWFILRFADVNEEEMIVSGHFLSVPESPCNSCSRKCESCVNYSEAESEEVGEKSVEED